MYKYGLDVFTGFFREDSIQKLEYIFEKLNDCTINTAQSIQLKQYFLSVIEQENHPYTKPSFVSPDGMHFIYCIFEKSLYVLLDPSGVTVLFQNWLIFEGELNVENVQWIETDNLVVLDLFYIVHSELQKCICHYSANDSAFVYFTQSRKVDRNTLFQDNPTIQLF